MPKFPTASRLHIARACVWPWWSPAAKWAYDRSDYADRGSLFHAWCAEQTKIESQRRTLDAIYAGLVDFAKEQGGEFRVEASDMRLVQQWIEVWKRDAAPMFDGAMWTAETIFAYDPTTGKARSLPPGTHPRLAWKVTKRGEITGAADVDMFPDPDTVTVIDWKTGRVENVEKPEDNPQMRFLGMAAAKTYGRKHARIVLAYVSEDGVQAEQADLNPDDFAKTETGIREILGRIAQKPEPVPGSHCKWCPARASCPETQRSIAVVADKAPQNGFRVTADAGAIANNAHAAWMLTQVRRVRQAADDVEAALKAYADDMGGIQLDGKVWARREIRTERIELTGEAEALLRKELPEALKTSASKSSIESACRKRKLPIAQTREALISQLADLGAVSESVSVRYEER